MTVIQGTPFDDTLLGTLGNDFIYGWQGNDVLNGADGEDILYGDQGNDSLTGGKGNDLLAGGSGNDVLDGGDGNDILYGGQGDDVLIGGLGGDRLFGEAGLDTFYLESGADTVTGGQDKDTFILFPTLGGGTLAEAAIITDFNPLEDELELENGLTFEGLNIFQGTENYANDTIIQDRNTGRYLAILLNVATPSFVPEAIAGTPVEETEVPAAEATEQPDIVFASPSLVMSPITQPGTPTDNPPTDNPPTDNPPTDNPPTDNAPIDDSIPGMLQFTASQFAVNEDGTSVLTITVERIEGSAGSVGATITLTDGTATAPDDYDNTPISVNFVDGDTTPKTIEVPIVDDTLIEGDETVNLTLFNPTGGASLGSQNTAILTLVDNDRPSQIQFSTPTYSIREDGGSATITVTRDSAIGTVSVDYATQTPTSNNAATADADYIPIQGTLTFNPGETTKTLTIPLLDDDLVEETETVQIALSNPSIGAILGENTTAILEILDHEPGLLEFISASSSGLEGNSGTAVDTVVGKIRRSGGSDGEVTVQVVLDNPAETGDLWGRLYYNFSDFGDLC